MRLVCPNCGAQYEVDDRVVPEGGRDVQCSACGHGWYQMPAGHEHEEPLEEAELDEALAEDDFEEGDEGAGEALEPETETETTEAEQPHEPEHEEPQAPPAVAAKPVEIDDGVRSILQEEAQRELEARADEAKPEPEPVETQPDLGLDDSAPSPEEERRRIARERMARMRGLDEDDELPQADFDANIEPSDTPEPPTQGRALFPDIEEINSTLDSHAPGAPASPEGAETVTRGTSGFGRGFMVVMLLAALLVALYVFAPKLAASVPALETALNAYVDAVNAARAWLDETLRGLTSKIQASTGG